MFHGHLDYFQKPPLGGRPNTKPGDHGTPNAHNRWFILFYHVWGPAWIEIHWNSIWLRVRSHMTSHYTWGSVTTLHDFGGGCWDNLWTLSFGLSQFHGHSSWFICEVALSVDLDLIWIALDKVETSHGYILMVHVNKHTFLNNVMFTFIFVVDIVNKGGPHSCLVKTIGRTYVSSLEINRHALPIIITK